jgi:hypothetical protein
VLRVKVHLSLEGSPEELAELRNAVQAAYPMFSDAAEPVDATVAWVLDQAVQRSALERAEQEGDRVKADVLTRRTRVEGWSASDPVSPEP